MRMPVGGRYATPRHVTAIHIRSMRRRTWQGSHSHRVLGTLDMYLFWYGFKRMRRHRPVSKHNAVGDMNEVLVRSAFPEGEMRS